MPLRHWTILRDRNSLPGLLDRQVVLTFDDGPNPTPGITDFLLDILKRHGIKACFCVIGAQARKSPHLINRMAQEGHVLVNHTYSHDPFLGVDDLRQDIRKLDDTLGKILGIAAYRSYYFRPPGGIITPSVRQIPREDSLTLVPVTYYAFDPWFGNHNYQGVVMRILRNASGRQGGMYVLHDYRHRLWGNNTACFHSPKSCSWIPKAVGQLLQKLRQQNFTFPHPLRVLESGSPEKGAKRSAWAWE